MAITKAYIWLQLVFLIHTMIVLQMDTHQFISHCLIPLDPCFQPLWQNISFSKGIVYQIVNIDKILYMFEYTYYLLVGN